MLVTFHCNHCNAKLRINANAMGSTLTCPECDGDITVPEQTIGPGFVIGGFLIKHKIGQGGMGEVYLARQLSLERDVALKILPAQFTRQSSFVVRFLKEVHYQAKLDHPNIVTAYDAGEDNGVYFMAMAHVAGETLEDFLDREGAMEEKEALKAIRQVALALQYASDQKDIIHRDIKPANIMITPTLHAKVLDMGLSKNVFDKNPTTHVDTLLGTPNYMSPEQIDRPREIDTRSDMFSLGMTFYHMLTGNVPFEDSSYLKTLKRHGEEKLEDPRTLMPGISLHAVHLIARLLARDPEARFPDWAGVLTAIEHALTGKLPVVALPAGDTTLAVDDTLNAPAPAPPSANPVPPDNATVANAAPTRVSRQQGITLSVAAGLVLGFAGITLLHRMLPPPPSRQPTAQHPAAPTPIPDTANVPTPMPEPRDLEALNRKFTAIVLDYERNPNEFDVIIRRLLEVATEAENTSIADRAVRQIDRIRSAREEALEAQRRRMRENTLTVLRDEGADAARAYLQRFDTPFEAELSRVRAGLMARIDAWEQQERSQREEELAQARAQYQNLLRDITPSILSRDYGQVLQSIDQAANRPSLFVIADEIAALRREIMALQGVSIEILETYRNLVGRETTLQLRGGPQNVRIRDVLADGMLVSKPLYAPDGSQRGNVEQTILFSELNYREVLQRMESLTLPHHDIYRGLIAHHTGYHEAARFYMQAAETDLSRAILRELTIPAQTFTPMEAFPDDLDLNRPRFDFQPNPAYP